ncbi:MAG: hypothetical protein KF696_02845 [Planctomycetes bacterium]|nr:hypothetical protein [Planctomycetota bacterium]MCW8134942.1 hypothetical protein [Planctomycetota bacterium]
MNRRLRKSMDRMLRKEGSIARNVEPPTPTEKLQPVAAVKSMRQRHNEEYLRRVRSAPPLRNDNLPRKVGPLTLAGAVGYQREMGFMLVWSGGWLTGTHLAIHQTDTLFAILMLAVAGLALALAFVTETTEVFEAARVLRTGHLTWGLITRQLNDQFVVKEWDGARQVAEPTKIRFLYASPAGQLVVTEFSPSSISKQDVLDDELELLLCNPDKPSEVQFVDLLPGSLRINSDGQVSAAPVHTVLGVGVVCVSVLFVVGLLWGVLRVVVV